MKRGMVPSKSKEIIAAAKVLGEDADACYSVMKSAKNAISASKLHLCIFRLGLKQSAISYGEGLLKVSTKNG